MERRKPLRRLTPLRRGKPLERSRQLTGGLPIRQVPIRRPAGTGPTREIRTAVEHRDRGVCLRCMGRSGGLQIHHRVARGMGGTSADWVNLTSNLVLLCADCHRWVEDHPLEAYRSGWKIRGRDTDPTTAPVRTRWGWVYLDNDAQWRGPMYAELRAYFEQDADL